MYSGICTFSFTIFSIEYRYAIQHKNMTTLSKTFSKISQQSKYQLFVNKQKPKMMEAIGKTVCFLSSKINNLFKIYDTQ